MATAPGKTTLRVAAPDVDVASDYAFTLQLSPGGKIAAGTVARSAVEVVQDNG